MAITVYKQTVKIKNYGSFEKICKFNRRNGLFEINYIRNVVSKNIVETDYVFADSLKEAEKKYNEKIKLFIAQRENYKEVILYRFQYFMDVHNGSGMGMHFNWGIFRKLDDPVRYYYERGGKNKYGKHPDEVWNITDFNFRHDKWKEIKWTKEREEFFNSFTEKFNLLVENLSQFFTESDFKDLFEKKLLLFSGEVQRGVPKTGKSLSSK